MILFFKEQRTQYLLSFLLFVLLFVFGYLHAAKGIDLTDEGFYLSTSMRYSLGDVPFRDEPQSTGHPFDLLVSLVFMAFPEISLLQMRSLGLLIDILSLFMLFVFFSRYAPPFMVALACSVVFFINTGILTPSYNSLSRAFSIVSLTSYLFACISERKHRRILFSALGGTFLSLSVLSYPSQILLIMIPLAVSIFCIFSATRRHIFYNPSLVFVGSFVLSMLLVAILAVSFGLLPDFIEGLSIMQSITPFGSSGPWVKLYVLLQQLFRIMPYGLGIMGVYLLAFLIAFTKRKRFNLVFGVIAIVVVFSVFVIPSPPANLAVFAFSLILALVSLFLDYKVDSELGPKINWRMIRNYAIAWGFLLALIYGVTSGNSVLQCRNGIAPLFIAGVVALYRFGDHSTERSGSASIKGGMWPAFVCIAMIPFIFSGLKYSYHNIYRDLDVDKLTSRFKHPKLKGIYSTSEKVIALEDLLDYLDLRVKPKDYFLAYNYIPMVYFLTQSRPSYSAVWARDDWPLSIRERLLNKMIEDNRIPEYCVRMLTWPMDNWKRVMSYDERSPLDSFVNSNYYLENIIYPFEIWHRGKGPKLRVFDQMTPVFQNSFSTWKGPGTITMRDLHKNAAPLILQGFRGDFNFSRISGEDGDAIRVSPFRKGEKGSMWIQFGYTLKKNGFDIDLRPGQQVIFIISARLSDKPRTPTLLFVQDKTETWDRNSVIIDKTSWERYIVSKRIRNGATIIGFGINWQPRNENESLEIEDIRIYASHNDRMVPEK